MAEQRTKTKQAVALEYNPAEDAPRIIASGTGALAERIIEKAKEADVPKGNPSSNPEMSFSGHSLRKSEKPKRHMQKEASRKGVIRPQHIDFTAFEPVRILREMRKNGIMISVYIDQRDVWRVVSL